MICVRTFLDTLYTSYGGLHSIWCPFVYAFVTMPFAIHTTTSTVIDVHSTISKYWWLQRMANSNKHCADFFTKGGHSCKFILSTATGGHSPMHKRYRYDM